MTCKISSLPRGSFLKRLLRSRKGNTLAIIAAAFVPVAGAVGGAVDMGRIYLVHTRLQQACDAGVLAARKSQSSNPTAATGVDGLTNAAREAANNFFKVNFAPNTLGSSDAVFSPSVPATDLSTVSGEASVILPLYIMPIFGYTTDEVKVNCSAAVSLSNTDVMFVLDTTGSMAETNPGDTVSRMEAMRDAVSGFYDQLEAIREPTTIIRYGFVPYSETVNVGAILEPNPGWLADQWTYQSRVPDGTDTVTGSGGETTRSDYSYTYVSGTAVSATTPLPLENCETPSLTFSNNWNLVSSNSEPYAGPPAGSKVTEVYDVVMDGQWGYVSQTPTSCDLTIWTYTDYRETAVKVTIPVYGSSDTTTRYWWLYKPVVYNVAGLGVGDSFDAPIGNNHTIASIRWNGCIEERGTVRTSAYWPIPANAYDMQIDLIPDSGNPLTQWGRALPELVYARFNLTNWHVGEVRTDNNTANLKYVNSGSYAICPTESKNLATGWDDTSLQAYLDSLVPSGQTYHDIGMVWGGRLISPTGLFAAANTVNGNLSRNIVFMTDGEVDTDVTHYDAYGWTAVDRRRQLDASVAPDNASNNAIVEARFNAICESIKAKGITIWVVAFGTAMTESLEDCASGDKAYQANNSAALTSTFTDIAAQVANLRLTK